MAQANPHAETGNHQTQYIANVQHFTQKDGLSNWQVNTIMQDSRGFIWAGTHYGLNRFDGHHFKVFTKEDDGLASNEVRSIIEDDEGWLWVFKSGNRMTFKSLDVTLVNINTLEIQTLEERFGRESLFSSNTIVFAFGGPEREILISTENGNLIKYTSKEGLSLIQTELKEKFRLKHYLGDNQFLGVQENFENRKYVNRFFKLDLNGSVSWEEKTYLFKAIPPDENGAIRFWRPYDEFSPAPIEMMELINNEKLRSYAPDPISGTNSLMTHQRGEIFYNKNADVFWYKSRFDLIVFHPEKGILYDFKDRYPRLVDNDIKYLFFDDRNNSWVATQNGIYKVQLQRSPFKKFLSLSYENYNILEATSVRGILKKENDLWVASEDICSRIDITTGEIIHQPNIYIYHNRGEKIPASVRPIIDFDEEHVLMGGKFLTLYNVRTHKYRTIQKDYGTPGTTWSLFRDSRQTFWLGMANNGLYVWKKGLDTLIQYEQYNNYESLKHSDVYAFLEWGTDLMFIGSNSGIYLLHKEKGVLKRFWDKGEGRNYFPHNSIFHMYRDKMDAEIIWVATGGGGLVRWKVDDAYWTTTDTTSTPMYKQFTTKDGLASNVIYAVYEDDNRNLWLPSNYGIIRLNKDGYGAKAYLEEDGISYHEFNRISHYQSEDGTLFFGGLNGLTAFHPDRILEDHTLNDVPLTIVDFEQFEGQKNKVVNKTAELIRTHRIELKPGDKFFNLEFALLDYQDGDRVRYSYLLEGRDKDWVYLEGNRLDQVTLPYGDYVLHVRGQSANGLYSNNQLAIPIHVILPVYLRNWFLLLSFLILSGLTFMLYNWRTRNLKKRQQELELEVAKATQTIQVQNEDLQKMDKLKSRFFANVSHELRTPLTLLLAPIQNSLNNNQLTNRDYSNLLLAKKNAELLHNMINEILDLQKLEAGKLRLQQTKVVWYLFLKKIVANFESFANQKNIDFHFQYDHQSGLQVSIDEKKMQIILTNLLSNAFKFTPHNGKISMYTQNEGPSLSIIVNDSGLGIDTEDLPYIFDRFYQSRNKNKMVEGGTGIGLALSRELVKLMGGTIQVDSQLGKGATFTVKIPRIEVVSQINTTDALKLQEALSDNASGFNTISTIAPIEHNHTDSEPHHAEESDTSTILLVEDNYDLRTFIKGLLVPKYKVVEAENGELALDLMKNQHGNKLQNESKTNLVISSSEMHDAAQIPDLIISDIMMPIMDGYQLLNALKSYPATAGIPVIMLTARGGMDDKLKALRIGVDDYMTKPFDEEELAIRVENLLFNAQNRESNISTENVLSDIYQSGEEQINQERQLTKENQQWLSELENFINDKIDNSSLTVEQLAHEMAISPRQMARRLKSLVGLTPRQYLKTLRFAKARELFENRTYSSVKAVAFSVGFKDVVHFSRQFKERYGKLPSSYL